MRYSTSWRWGNGEHVRLDGEERAALPPKAVVGHVPPRSAGNAQLPKIELSGTRGQGGSEGRNKKEKIKWKREG